MAFEKKRWYCYEDSLCHKEYNLRLCKFLAIFIKLNETNVYETL